MAELNSINPSNSTTSKQRVKDSNDLLSSVRGLVPSSEITLTLIPLAFTRSPEGYTYLAKGKDGYINLFSLSKLPKDTPLRVIGSLVKQSKGLIFRVENWANVKGDIMNYLYPEMKVMDDQIQKMVEHIRNIKNERIVVKHHNDADGISSALIFYRMFKALGANPVFIQNNTAVYYPEDAIRDLMSFSGYHFIFLDFGNNVESQKGIDILVKEIPSLSIVDHHLSDRTPGKELVVTPVWNGLGGEYTAGLVAYEIARRVVDADYDELYKVSLFGDKSSLPFENSPIIEKTALAFDYLATVNRKGIKFIDDVAHDPDMINSLYQIALDRIDELVEVGLKAVKEKTLGEWKIYLLNLDHVMGDSDSLFPPKGKVTGAVHDRLSQNHSKVITIGYTDNSLMFRATKEVQVEGFNANSIIQKLKTQFGSVILSGGGHPGAAAMRFRKGFKTVLVNAIIEEMRG